MPGFIINIGGKKAQVNDALASLKFGERFDCRLLFEREHTQIFFNSYEEYPSTVFENDSFFCLVEGCVYNTSLELEVNFLFTLIEKCAMVEVQELVKRLDGEFVFCFYLKVKNQIVLINDAWARLPVYYAIHQGAVVFSREISFVKSFLSNPKLSKVDAALYAMFGYTLGEKTIYSGISKVAPNSIATVSLLNAEVEIISGFDFKALFQPSATMNQLELIRNLEEAILHRISKFDKPSLSLSGGLDSRLIAGLIAKKNYAVDFTTYASKGAHEAMDVIGAIEISKSLKRDKSHSIVRIEEPSIDDEKYLSKIKQGLNGLEMAFIIPYLKNISKSSDCSLTGDGGDKFFVDLHPLVRIKSKEHLVRYLLKSQTQLSPEFAGKLFDISPSEILLRIDEVLDGYHLADWGDIYAAFQIKERGINWLFEGEDRNRYFIWSTSPFYNPSVIKYAMSVSMISKQKGELFRELFGLIPGNLGQIINPNWKLPLDAKKKINWVFQKQKIKALIPQYFFSLKNGEVNESKLFSHWKRRGNHSIFNLSSLEFSRVNPVVLKRLETIFEQFKIESIH